MLREALVESCFQFLLSDQNGLPNDISMDFPRVSMHIANNSPVSFAKIPELHSCINKGTGIGSHSNKLTQVMSVMKTRKG